MKEFGKEIRRLREEKGITQQQIASQFYVSTAAVSRWESGARLPDLMTAKKLADYFGVSLDSILDEDEFKEYTEKAPVMETDRSGRIQTCLYTIAAIAFLFRFIGFFLFPETHDGSLQAKACEILELIISAGGLGALGAGVILSLRTDLNPKMAGIIGICFFAAQTVSYLVVDSFIFNGILMAVIPLLCIWLLIRFFIQENNGSYHVLQLMLCLYFLSYIIGCFLQSETYSYASTSFVTRYRFLWSFTEPLGTACLMGLLLWQTFSVFRKRKIASMEYPK